MFWAVCAMFCGSNAAVVRADDVAARTAADKVQEGNDLLARQQYAEAMAAYDEAKKSLPESAEVAYNRGIALYRMGEFEKATKALQDALKPDKPELESKVKYNLGRNAHEAAIAKRDKPPEAINDLSKAVSFYKDALSLNEKDGDARKNMEEAERLRAFLEKRLKEQQQDKDKKPSSQPTSQPDKKEPTSQPDKQQTSQPSSQPNEDKEKQGDQKKEDQDEEEKKDQQKQDESRKQKGQQGKDQQDKQSQDQKDSDADKQDGKEGQAKDEDQKMKAEEVEPMLQEARDAEKARREAKHARMMRLRGKIPVKKDW